MGTNGGLRRKWGPLVLAENKPKRGITRGKHPIDPSSFPTSPFFKRERNVRLRSHLECLCRRASLSRIFEVVSLPFSWSFKIMREAIWTGIHFFLFVPITRRAF